MIDAAKVIDPLNDKECRELLIELIAAMNQADLQQALDKWLSDSMKRALAARWETGNDEET